MVRARVSAGGTVIAENFYDGEGLRIKKRVGAVTTYFVYDADRELMAEYQEGGTPTSGIQYLVADQLGSTRMLVDSAGVALQRYNFAPFGALMDNQTVGNVKQLFTGKERDSELANSAIPDGLDYFGARYFSSAQGRFTSPDPKMFPHDLTVSVRPTQHALP